MITQDIAGNPLINPPALPNNVPAFDKIKPEHFKPAFEHALEQAKIARDQIRFNPDAPTFQNTVEALELFEDSLSSVYAAYSHFTSCNISDELMGLSEWVSKAITEFSVQTMHDPILFERVNAVYNARKSIKLSTEQKTLLRNTHRGFIESGVQLSDTDKQRFQQISEELSIASEKFEMNNVRSAEEKKIITDDVSLLNGVPEETIANYAAMAQDIGLTGKWVVTDETATPVLKYAKNREFRARVHAASATQSTDGEYDNHPTIMQIISLRRELAELMGYETFAHMALKSRMAENPKTVFDFLYKNLEAYRKHGNEHLDRIKKLALEMDGITDFKPSDYQYYNTINMEQSFHLDEKEISKYFSLENVLNGVIKHSEKLFDICFTNTNGKYPVWNDDVQTYDVHDVKTGKLIGVFYGDYYARSNQKQSGAWMNGYRTAGIDSDGKKSIPLIINCCNFMKPADGQKSQLTLDEVITVFHEMGHGLHGLLGKGRYKSLTGTSVARDFVELPSQVQENWALEKDVLKTYAFHKDTGAVIPDDLINKIIANKNYAAAYLGLRQTYFGLLDMAWQTTHPNKIKSVEALEDSIIEKCGLPPRIGNGLMSTSFSHIFSGGYAAGYYGYKWAEILDADVFSAFTDRGDLYDPELKQKLRQHIYEKGGTRKASNLFRAFMGRAPDPAAPLRREGLLPTKVTPGIKPPPKLEL